MCYNNKASRENGLVAQLGERTVRIREVRGFDPLQVHQSKIIRTTSSQSEMGSDFALSSMISNPAANTVSASQNKDMEEIIMKKLLSCEFNVDTARVELKYSDSSMLSIDCDGVEDEYAKTIRQRSALDYLVYNAPLEYAELVLCGDVEGYLRNVTDYRSFNEWE